MLKIGILAFQGAITEHQKMLEQLGVEVVLVKKPADLSDLAGLIIPGGESTAIGRLLRSNQMIEPIKQFSKEGKYIFGTCAGLILCGKKTEQTQFDEVRLGIIDIEAERNGFGRQKDSFETQIWMEKIKTDVPAVFIRAPYIRSMGDSVTALASFEGTVVAAESKTVLVTSFHPELTDNLQVMNYFIEKIQSN